MSRPIAALRAAASAGALALVVAGIPFLLLATVGNPWPGRSQIELRDELAIVTGLLAALTWLVWARFTLLVVVELTRQIGWVRAVRAANRTSGAIRPVRVEPLPAAAGGLATAVQRLIATILILVPLTTRSPRPAEAAPPLPVIASANPAETAEIAAESVEPLPSTRWTARAADGESRPAPEITVGPNETLRSLAGAHLGDASRWREIFEMNTRRTQVDGRRLVTPSALRVGWQLTLPDDAREIPTSPIATNEARRTELDARTTTRHVTQPGEGPWHVAAALTGDGARWQEVLDANIGSEVAEGVVWTSDQDTIHPGWTFTWPAAAEPAAAAPVDAPDGYAPASAHVVVEGDTLWELSEARLAAHGVDDGVATARYVGAVVDANPSISDPDLIYPSERLLLPQIGVEPERRSRDEAPEAPRERPRDDRRVRSEPGVGEQGGRRDQDGREGHGTPRHARDRGHRRDDVDPAVPRDPATSVDQRPDSSSSTAATTSPSTSVAAEETSPTTGAVPDAAPGGDVEGHSVAGPRAPVGLGIAAASVGVLTVLGSLRRRRLRATGVRTRLERPPQDVVETERLLRRVEGVERSARIDVAVRAAASSMLDTRHRLVAMIVETDGHLCAIADGPVALSPPWKAATPHAERWELPSSASLVDLAPAARQVSAPCPALVAIGVTPSGAEVHVDPESSGSLAVEAEGPIADQVLASIAVGLAGSALAEAAQLVAVGVPATAFLGHANHQEVGTLDEALELVSELTTGVVPGTSTFQLRARHTGGESWEPAIVLVGSSHLGELRLLVDRPGLAYVIAGSRPNGAGLRLVPGDGSWRLEPLGIELIPAGLTSAELDQIDDLLAHERAAVVDAVVEQRGVDQRGEEFDEPDKTLQAEWSLLVRVMGLVDVVDRDGQRACFGKSKALELLAWIATHRDRATRQGARSALWDVDVRDATFANIVSEARRAAARLCEPAPGEEWLARTMNANLGLHEHVVTDAELLADQLARARRERPEQAIETLRAAVELIRGVPFAESGYLWPDAEGITSQLVVLATSCCSELAELLLEQDDIEGVFWATGQGLKVLPGHEELIAYRMRAHGRRGDRAGVRSEWATYERALVADPWCDGEPAPTLVALREELLATAVAAD